MHKLGISIVALFYFGAGSSVGGVLFDLAHGRAKEVFRAYGVLAFTVVSNLVLLPCLFALWRQRHQEPEIKALESRQVFQGLPINARIAFLVFAISWGIGFFVPIVFGF